MLRFAKPTYFMTLVAVIVVTAVIAHCGSKLPQQISINRPIAMDSPVNLDEVAVGNLADGTQVNVGSFMREQKLDYLVLTFGSQGCSVCMEKAHYFETNVVGDYSIFGKNAKGRIKVVGVLTDPVGDRESVKASLARQGLTHLTWSDPGHLIMMKHFQPAGYEFSVPLTVMLSKKGIVWRVTSKEKMDPSALVTKIAGTLGSDVVIAPAAPPPPTLPPSPPTLIGQLASEAPDRLTQVTVTPCGGTTSVNLGTLLPTSSDLRAVLVHKDACAGNSDCVNAQSAVKSWSAACAASWSKNCSYAELIVGGPSTCSDANLYQGGSEFFNIFADHFSWSYKLVDAGGGLKKLSSVNGPLTMIFNSKGWLVFSQEGKLDNALTQRMGSDQMANRATGPDFPVQWAQNPKGQPTQSAAVGFSAMRAPAKYTLILFWESPCTSCRDEIQKWHSDSSSVYNFCLAHASFCQVAALESQQKYSGMDPPTYLSSLLNGSDGWLAKNYTMPIAVERPPYSDGRAPNGWSYDGWYLAKFGDYVYRSVLYDREGKVINSWPGDPNDTGAKDGVISLYNSDPNK